QGERGKSGVAVKLKQQDAKQKDEARRKEVTDTIEKIYQETKQTVETRLTSLESDVSGMFDKGIEAAMTKMTGYINQRMDAYKAKRYGVIGGSLLWIKDKLLGLPDEVNIFYTDGRKVFTQELDALVVSIANLVETRLKEAKDEITRGQKRIREYVQSLPKDLQAVGKAAEKEVAGRFEELRRGVDEKKNALAQKLAQRYKEATDKANEQLKKMQEENKGLVSALIEKLGEVIKILRAFKERITSMLKKGKETIMLIVSDPIGFLKNLLNAVKKGIQQFVDNIWKHLKAGFMAWLFGSLAEAGIEIPSDFSLGSILKLVLQVLGLTYDRIRAKAVKLIGERNVMLLEKAWELISALIKGGPAALWEKIKEFLGNLKEMVINAIQEWVVNTVIKSAITKLATMFSPVGAIIQAIITIYNTVMFFIERMNQILALVEAIINSVHKIATGDISSAANWVEQAMARTVPVIIGFLARLLGLSGISEKIKEIIKKIQDTVDKAIDKLIDKIVKGIGKLFGKGKADEKGSGDPQHDAKVNAGLLAIDQEDAKLQKEGKIEKADAEKVAAKVKRDHPIFKSVTVVDGGETWDYDYVASPGKKKKGEKKKDSDELKKAKAAFGKRLFTREELEGVLGLAKTTVLGRVEQWKKDGILHQLATTTFDTFTQYSFDSAKGGEREIISENKREMYGYKNPAKDSATGLQILSKGLRADSPRPIKTTDATYHKQQALYRSVVPGSGFTKFPYGDAILGHKGTGASGHWNKTGHKQTRADNQAWNNDSANYRGPEHKSESAASGASAQRYRIPSKAAGSHSDWWKS
ncbi:MAG: hypothetical protein J2P36_13915, partial [Ktedonobacteraceae bacterium]|nr:hypothetical protein [Ktedonobacteraceae bacterium]